jgi:cytochrome b561
MRFTNSYERYGAIHQLLHWGMAFSIIGLLAMGFFFEDAKKILDMEQAYFYHKSLGITILLLVIFRMFWRYMNHEPNMPNTMGGFQIFAARLVHLLLYVGMIVMPLAGWVMSNAAGYPVSLWGYYTLPNIVGKSKELAELANKVHELGGWTMIGAISIHFLAALFHQFVQKDHLMVRMLPMSAKKAAAVKLTPEEKVIVNKAPWA